MKTNRMLLCAALALACCGLVGAMALLPQDDGLGNGDEGDDDLFLAGQPPRGWLLRDPDISWTKDFVGINIKTPTERLDVKGSVRIRNDALIDQDLITPGLRVLLTATTPNVIGGSSANEVGALIVGATIGGGGDVAAFNSVLADFATVSGGQDNLASGLNATVGGGVTNEASGLNATVSGGSNNVADDAHATVGGGDFNLASGDLSTVGGGGGNIASAPEAVVGGGETNTASGPYSTVAGGCDNVSFGAYSAAPGGRANEAAGNYSFAAGRRAKATAIGSFAWADSTDADFTVSVANSFRVRASGGAIFYSSDDLSTGVELANGGGSWSDLSDRNVKENFADVDGREVLQRVVSMPLTTWNYMAQAPEIRHMGPMAQDFYAAFGIGECDTRITTIDADGVAFAAIQGLHELLLERDLEIASLRASVEAATAHTADLEIRLARLEAALAQSPRE